MDAKYLKFLTSWYYQKHLPEMVVIENLSYAAPWTQKEFEDTLADKKYGCRIAVENRTYQVLGYLIYELRYKVYEIINLTVHPEYLRNGIGTELLRSLKFSTGFNSRNRVEVYVREENLPVQLFFKHFGFTCIQIVANHYVDSLSNAYKFEFKPDAVDTHNG